MLNTLWEHECIPKNRKEENARDIICQVQWKILKTNEQFYI